MWYLNRDLENTVTPAETYARVTGSRGATSIVERRDPRTGQLVTVSVDTHNVSAPVGWCGTESHPSEAHERRTGCIAFFPLQ